MRGTDISKAIGEVSDHYIKEASKMNKNNTTTKALKIWKIVGIAACALLAVSVTIIIIAVSEGSSSSRSGARESYFEGGYYDYGMDGAVAEEVPKEAEYSSTTGAVADSAGGSGIEANAQKIIYSASISLQSTEFEDSSEKISAIVEKHGGYLESAYVNNQAAGYRSGEFSIRVPVENYEKLVEELKNVCTVVYMNESAQDITESYHDIESRLDTAKTKLKRLQELLAAAEDMSDIITIETAISDTEWEIDDYQRILNSYDSQVSYSTVNVSLSEVYKVANPAAPLTFGEKIGKAFSDGLSGFAEGMGDIAIWLAESWTWLLFVGVIIAAVVVVIVVIVKRRNKKSNIEE